MASQTEVEQNQEIVDFMREVVSKLTPAVVEAITKKDSGKFEVHFSVGKLTRIRKDVSI